MLKFEFADYTPEGVYIVDEAGMKMRLPGVHTIHIQPPLPFIVGKSRTVTVEFDGGRIELEEQAEKARER